MSGWGTESDGRSADSSLLYDPLELDPAYASVRDGELSPVWKYSEDLRTILRNRGTPVERDREQLATDITRQLSSLVLYKLAAMLKAAGAADAGLYVILFPGEAKDNTGIKDLNDKILGYALNNEFIACRQKAVTEVFWYDASHLPPKFVTTGYDYKSAQVLAVGKTRKDFADALVLLDEKIKKCLLDLLPRAAKEADDKKDDKRKQRIEELQNKLWEKGYRFDFLYGVRILDFKIDDPLEATFLLTTEALKGAGVARLLGKADGATTKSMKKLAKPFKPDPEDQDRRGKRFDLKDFLKLAKTVGDIKDIIRKSVNLLNIFIDAVWAMAIFEYRRGLFVLNPDVVRDVRKKLLVRPDRKAGYGYKGKKAFAIQKELLEAWLIAANGLDFVKDFLNSEFQREVAAYHAKAELAFDDVRARPATRQIGDWNRIEEVLTRDHRRKNPIAVLGNASEFQFYARSSDFATRIFFTMDIRDLGVHVALLYDLFMGAIEVQKPAGARLMKDTFESTDLINERKRFTYEKVVEAFRNSFNRFGTQPSRQAAIKAFEPGAPGMERPGSFDEAVQIMLGGDEIFIAAHPFFAGFIHEIIRDIRAALFRGMPLDLRVGIAFSRAIERTPQKEANWEAHDQAFSLSSWAAGALKHWERTERRIDRLIDKLEANEKKKKHAPGYRQRLRAFGLGSLYARALHGAPEVFTPEEFRALAKRLINVLGCEKEIELVDLNGQVVDCLRLRSEVAALEKEVVAAVGLDNIYIDQPPLLTELPWWAQAILDFFLPKEKYPYDPDPDDPTRTK